MDFHCPSRPPPERRPVRAYLLEPDIPEEERMVEVSYPVDRSSTDNAGSKSDMDIDSENEVSGNDQGRRMTVDAEKDN